MREQIFRKKIFYRLSAYLLLLPFIPGIRPILNNYEFRDLIVFISGFLITVTLIIMSNRKPYLKVTEKTLQVFLLHSHKPEIHNFSSIESVKIRKKNKLTLSSKGFDPLEIRLGNKEQIRLISIFESEDIQINKADRNS